MDRPARTRPRAPPQQEGAKRAQSSSWVPSGVIASVGTIGLVGAAGFLAYRYFAAPAHGKKSRSKHGKKDKKKKQSDEVVKAPKSSKSGTSTPRTPPRSESPPIPTKPVADSSRMDQLAWCIEVAKDQFEARGLRHAKYYAEKALELGSKIPDFNGTLSYSQMRYISIFVSPDRESKFTELKAVADLLNKMEPTEGGKQEFVLYKGRVLSTLSDSAVKRKEWKEAEAYCDEVLMLYQKSFAGQEDQLNTNMGIQYYQLTVIKRNLKKLEEAVACAEKAYEHIVKSKLKPEFSSAIARQRADILDGLDRFDEAKVVMMDHIERLEAKQKASLEAKQKALLEKDKTVKQDGEDEVGGDEEDDDMDSEDAQNADSFSPNNLTDNMLFLARLLFEHECHDEASALLRKAIDLFPSPYYYSMLAGVLFEAGKVDEALEVQAQLKKLRMTGEFPIASSKNLLTKVHYLRQAKADGPWTVHIQLSNQPIKTLDEARRLQAGSLLEVFVRRHYNADEAVAGTTVTMGPFIYIVKGDEPEHVLTIKGILPQALESNAVYEIVVHQYPSQSSDDRKTEKRIGTHRQLARAMAFSSISMANFMQPPEDFSDDLDDYALPEPIEDEEEALEIGHSEVAAAPVPAPIEDDDEVADEVNADEEATAQLESSPSSSTEAQKKENVVSKEITPTPVIEETPAAPVAIEEAQSTPAPTVEESVAPAVVEAVEEKEKSVTIEAAPAPVEAVLAPAAVEEEKEFAFVAVEEEEKESAPAVVVEEKIEVPAVEETSPVTDAAQDASTDEVNVQDSE